MKHILVLASLFLAAESFASFNVECVGKKNTGVHVIDTNLTINISGESALVEMTDTITSKFSKRNAELESQYLSGTIKVYGPGELGKDEVLSFTLKSEDEEMELARVNLGYPGVYNSFFTDSAGYRYKTKCSIK